MEGYQRGEGGETMGAKGKGNKKYKWQVENRQGEVKNNMGNGEAKELICMTHEHEIRWENAHGRGREGGKVQRIRRINGRQKIDRGRVRTVWEMQKPKNLYV